MVVSVKLLKRLVIIWNPPIFKIQERRDGHAQVLASWYTSAPLAPKCKFTCSRKWAKPAVASREERRVRASTATPPKRYEPRRSEEEHENQGTSKDTNDLQYPIRSRQRRSEQL